MAYWWEPKWKSEPQGHLDRMVRAVDPTLFLAFNPREQRWELWRKLRGITGVSWQHTFHDGPPDMGVIAALQRSKWKHRGMTTRQIVDEHVKRQEEYGQKQEREYLRELREQFFEDMKLHYGRTWVNPGVPSVRSS